MKLAVYSGKESNHFALGLDEYCHFTSPIRRIVDAYIHYYLTYSQNTFLNLESLNKLDAKIFSLSIS